LWDNVARDQIVDYLCFGSGECVATMMPVSHPALQSETIGPGRLMCLLPLGHRLASCAPIDISDLVGETLIAFEHDTSHGAPTESFFAAAGERYDPRILSARPRTAIAFVQEGLGTTLIDEFSAIGAEARGLVSVPVRNSAALPLYVHRPLMRPPSALTRAFADMMRKAAQAGGE